MKKVLKMNPYMFNLLIEKGIDNFSVVEIRDALMECAPIFEDKEQARKYVYRQLLSFERKGWLISAGIRREKRYFLTQKFNSLYFEPRKSSKEESISTYSEEIENMIDMLRQEKTQYEAELAIVLGELEEYQSLLVRFPSNKVMLIPIFDVTKKRSEKLLGKINALANWIHATKS
ncbi:hypothetical protein [Vibrio parahaemolyticus]|uniref:hypothetical protein n=1 Tax=Vibrio parahaemolyticus TaxID=670 RepID=UPI001F289678|nr:hypothetical protein [Vibrio parahaemolyticus]MBE4056085.1 hypothetical protein [Vibrio parahaemolyticus]UJX30389.1 hypothetical protein JHS79_04965 [Vibrio parahaemolyticus]HCG9193022.1 hypothetical protein [Vibrio parahaemolyticus]HCG9194574.1 hypothetical protein [Vibrio parahaemolyticus]HCH0833163.1 hypothetical protein [Vibrio parahaemolyticus]